MKRDLKWMSRLFGRALVYGLHGAGMGLVHGAKVGVVVGTAVSFVVGLMLFDLLRFNILFGFLPLGGPIVGFVLGSIPSSIFGFLATFTVGLVLPAKAPRLPPPNLEKAVRLWLHRFAIAGTLSWAIASVSVDKLGVFIHEFFEPISLLVLAGFIYCGFIFGLWLGCREWLENHRRETENSPLLEN